MAYNRDAKYQQKSEIKKCPDSNESLLEIELGNCRYVRVVFWNESLRVDIREWEKDRPSKIGVSLTLTRWLNFCDIIEEMDRALKEGNIDKKCHLGGNVFATVSTGYKCINIRQFYKPESEELRPTRKGIALRTSEWNILKDNVSTINFAIPDINAVIPCHMQADHSNLQGALRCSECNPNNFTYF